MATQYRIYKNDGAGGPIDYGTVVATVTSGTTYDTAPIATGSDVRFAVRAFDSLSTQEEKNVDAFVRIVTNGSGVDVTNRPLAPTGLTAAPRAGGKVRVRWRARVLASDANRPTTFNVYKGTGGSANYASAAATVAATPGLFVYEADLTGLTNGVAYTVGVRASNATGEEPNTTTTVATADATAPDNVDSLTITATT